MLFWAWWPQPGTYRPIQPNERGLITELLPSAQHVGRVSPAVGATRVPPCGALAERRLADGAPLQATFQKGQALPSKAHPRLAMVLVPRKDAHDHGNDGQPRPSPGLPFDKPLPPDEGDNQAAAFNTTDDSVAYDVAFALVWATGDEVLNVNEAHAYASCSNCVTVAVAFQVVLIMDHARVVVPQNLSVAANYQCYRCITAAIASQLVLSVEDTPGEDQLLALGDVWAGSTHFGQTITSYLVAQISSPARTLRGQRSRDSLRRATGARRAPPTAASHRTPRCRQQRPSPAGSVARARRRPSPSGNAPHDSTPPDPAPTDTTPADRAPPTPHPPTPPHRHHARRSGTYRSGTPADPTTPAVSRPDDRSPPSSPSASP